MWKHGSDAETPAEFKRRYAQAGVETANKAEKGVKEGSPSGGVGGWLGRIWSK